jgi:hypothetical protein
MYMKWCLKTMKMHHDEIVNNFETQVLQINFHMIC